MKNDDFVPPHITGLDFFNSDSISLVGYLASYHGLGGRTFFNSIIRHDGYLTVEDRHWIPPLEFSNIEEETKLLKILKLNKCFYRESCYEQLAYSL